MNTAASSFTARNMMTTMAALLGGVPLMLGAGTGAEIRQPLGYAIVGGLIAFLQATRYFTNSTAIMWSWRCCPRCSAP
jgi:HAE1 family hydrophobic/amphiphilic exporter-1